MALVVSTLNNHLIYLQQRVATTTFQELCEDYPDSILDMVMEVDNEAELVLFNGYHKALANLFEKARTSANNTTFPVMDISKVYTSAYCKKFMKLVLGDDFELSLKEERRSFINERKWIRHKGRQLGIFHTGLSKKSEERYRAWLNGESADAKWDETVLKTIAGFFLEFYDYRWYERQFIVEDGGRGEDPEMFCNWIRKKTKGLQRQETQMIAEQDVLWEREDSDRSEAEKSQFSLSMRRWKAMAKKTVAKMKDKRYADTVAVIENIIDAPSEYPLVQDWKESLGYSSKHVISDVESRCRTLSRLFAYDKFAQNGTHGELFATWARACLSMINRHRAVAQAVLPRMQRRHDIIDLDRSDEIILIDEE